MYGYLDPNIPPQKTTVCASSPTGGPSIEYVTFKGPWFSVAGSVKIWWNFRGAINPMACTFGDFVVEGITSDRKRNIQI
jgi:hypothetical protein